MPGLLVSQGIALNRHVCELSTVTERESGSFYRCYGKRMIDVIVASVLLVTLAPVLLVVAALVRQQLGRPVLFWQQRPGYRGVPFWLCKFRTMTEDRDSNHRLLSDEQRLTRLGKLLRLTSVDELPELWNVLRGQMSLAGPRPLLLKYLDRYTPRQARRHDVRPGITGLAQINGRNALSWEERFELDVHYVERLSFWLDCKIFVKTLSKVLRCDSVSAPGRATVDEFQGTPRQLTCSRRKGRTMIPRIAFAANRQIGCDVLNLLLQHDVRPSVLLLPSEKSAGAECDQMLRRLDGTRVLRGDLFRQPEGIRIMEEARLDYVLSIHFPYIIPPSVLAIPRVGTLNLHPSYLPYNRGWHTPSWAIIDGTPFGATLHWADESLDSGEIAMQTTVDVSPDDTADTLYQRVLAAEVQLMRDAIPRMLDYSLPRLPQHGNATEHRKADLGPIQELRLSDVMSVDQLLRRLRGLTTNRSDEATYFERNGVRYRIRVEISREPSVGAAGKRGEGEQDSPTARVV